MLKAKLNTDAAPIDAPAPILAGYMSEQQLAGELSVAVRTLERWRAMRIGPPVTRLGRTLFYSRASFLAWLETREERLEAPRRRRA